MVKTSQSSRIVVPAAHRSSSVKAASARGSAKRTVDRHDPQGSKAMRTVSMRLPTDLVDGLKKLAKMRAWPYQALARSILTEFVAGERPSGR